MKIVSGPRTFSASFHLGATHIATEPLGSRRLRRDIPHSVMHLLHKKELDHSEKKTPLKPWSIPQPLDFFPTSPFRRVKRRRGCGGAGKFSPICSILSIISANKLHNNPWNNRLLLTPAAKWRDGQNGRGRFGQCTNMTQVGEVWLTLV